MRWLLFALLLLPRIVIGADIGGGPISNPELEKAKQWVYSGKESWDRFETVLAGVRSPKPYKKITFQQCGAVNAFFQQGETIVVCYELVDKLMKEAARHEKPGAIVFGALRYIILHEYGHGLIKQSPAVLGKEEDAADQIAAIFARHL